MIDRRSLFGSIALLLGLVPASARESGASTCWVWFGPSPSAREDSSETFVAYFFPKTVETETVFDIIQDKKFRKLLELATIAIERVNERPLTYKVIKDRFDQLHGAGEMSHGQLVRAITTLGEW